jgi:type I restriction enzyme S subunit
VLKLGAVTSCRYIAQENKALPLDLGHREDIEVKKGDLLFTRKNTYQLVAASAFVYETRPKLMLSDTIFRFNFKRNAAILPEYVWALLTHPGKRKDLQKLAGGSAGSMPNISKSRLMKQLIELPPIEFQQNFRNVFYRVRSCIDSQTNTHNLATEFFNSLSQRAFRGEL